MGRLRLDLVAEVERLPRPGEVVSSRGLTREPGGPGVVQAVAAARLGARVAAYGWVGLDPFGDEILALLNRVAIDTSGIERSPEAPTAASLVFVDPQGTQLAAHALGATGCLDAAQVVRDLPRMGEADGLLLDLAVPAPAAIALLGGLPASCPVVASHPAGEDPGLHWARLDFLVGTRDEFLGPPGLAGGDLDDAARAGEVVLDRGVRHAVVVGADGVYLVEKGGVTRFPAHTSLVNLSVAVDALSAALAVRFAGGSGLYEAVGFACAAASLSSAQARGLESLPTSGAVQALLARFNPHPSRPAG